MYIQIKTSFLFYTFTLFICFSSFFVRNTAAQGNNESAVAASGSSYTFESIDVQGVDFLAVTASSDFEDYAGYTKSPDGEKEVAFTLIDGVFTTYDFLARRKRIFTRSVITDKLPDTTKIATVYSMESSWKMESCANTIFQMPSKRKYSVSVMPQAH